MPWDAMMKFTLPSVGGIHPQGESRWNDGSFPLVDDWGFSLENKVNVTQHTTGAGAGKAQFEPFTIKKQVDSASADLFLACGCGAHFHGVQVSVYKSTGNQTTPSQNAYIMWTYNLVAIEKIEWSYEEVAPQELITLKFGACSISYGKQSDQGIVTPKALQSWSQVTNQNSIVTQIMGAVSPFQVGS